MHQSTANNAAPFGGSLLKMPDGNGPNFRRRRAARRSTAPNSQMPGFGFAPPTREPSPGALPALLALALGFAIALALYVAFDASTRTGVQFPSGSELSQ